MKKILLSTTLLSLLSIGAHADSTVTPRISAPLTPAVPQVINCEYSIPTTTGVDEATLSTWATKAATQSFDFNSSEFDAQLTKLKLCYTNEGWEGFHDALEKSGNIKAIQSQSLTVTSQIEGELHVKPIKENQWKVTLPLGVVYQNTQERLTQLLTVDLLIGRKPSGDLGIVQIIAIPREMASAPASKLP